MTPDLANSGRFRIGTSGYEYDHWKGLFYPDGMLKTKWFDHYTQHFDTVELNSTFYRVPGAEAFARWREAAPPGFEYVLKYSRFGAHYKRLTDAPSHIAYYMERAGELGATLGPILLQLPPRWKANAERLDAFLSAAPQALRWAVEFRDASWLSDEVFSILRRHNAALTVHDRLPDHPQEPTADWVYLRFHGPRGDYSTSYSAQQLEAAARRVREHRAAGLDVYAFFNNDVEGHAVRNAMTLRQYVEDRRTTDAST